MMPHDDPILKHVISRRVHNSNLYERIEILWPSLVSELQMVASWTRWLGAFTPGSFKELIMFRGWKHAFNLPNMETKEMILHNSKYPINF